MVSLINLPQPKLISASILSANLANLGLEVTAALTAGANWIHVDVMDNHFVPDLTFGPLISKALRNYGITAPLDIHLMAKPVDRLIKLFAATRVDHITIHPESTDDLVTSLELINRYGCKVGIAINPTNSIEIIKPYINNLDLVLIMTVTPGAAGQPLLANSYHKISETRQLIDNLSINKQILLAIDGGVNQHNINQLASLGVDVFVVGSSIFNQHSITNNLAKLLANLK